MDDISDVVYVTEMNSYKLQYMNKAAKLGVGLAEDDTSYIDKHCYKVLQVTYGKISSFLWAYPYAGTAKTVMNSEAIH